ncbi:MAG: VOC family protein [Chloroflexi bacterium]|nr:VOC family protein [Chloroflexota bacterium]
MISTQISYIALWSKNLDANRNIFANLLGIPIVYEDEDVVVFQTQGTQLVLQRARDADADLDGTIQFGFEVDDLDMVTQTLEQGGQTISVNREELDHSQRVTVLRLPSGQSVEFIGR